jgi:hypothetical protein
MNNKGGVSIMAMSECGKTTVVICLMLCLVAAFPTLAEGSEYAKDGLYLGALFAHNSMDGDFDDTHTIGYRDSDRTDVFDVPDVDDGAGFGLVLGRRFHWISLEFGYQNTRHDTSSSLLVIDGEEATLAIGDSKATYQVFDLNVKIDVFARDRLRPYVLLGGGLTTLDIEDSRSEGPGQPWNKKAEYSGYCLNAGVGAAYYFHPQWAVMGGLIHRWNTFNHLKGARLDNNIHERALGFTVGLAYTF